MTGLFVVVVSFALMEPFTYASHRFVMHGLAERAHRSHHVATGSGWEANDLFPVVFAAFVMAAMAVGFNVGGYGVLVPVGVGVTLYGAVYAMVHDGYIHGRVPFFTRRVAVLEHLAAAHRIHHLYGGEPFGMLFPIVPASLRQRAALTDRDPLHRPS